MTRKVCKVNKSVYQMQWFPLIIGFEPTTYVVNPDP